MFYLFLKYKKAFYSAKSGLKLQEVATQEAQGQVYISTISGDYKSVQGVKFPFAIKQEAGMQKFDFKTSNVEVNTIQK